jgi:hypothetical protein
MNLHNVFDGSALGVVFSALVMFFSMYRKAIKRMDRDETLKKDYPPHRHINGKLIYPREYQPARMETLAGSD